MSPIVSRRPSSRNHWNEAFWMSIRLGRSRTCWRRENDLRARGEATVLVKEEASLGDVRVQAITAGRGADERDVGATRQGTGRSPFCASESLLREPVVRGKCSAASPRRQAEPRNQVAWRQPGCRTWLPGSSLLQLDRGPGLLELRLDGVGLL